MSGAGSGSEHRRGQGPAGGLAALSGVVLFGSLFLTWYSNPEALELYAELPDEAIKIDANAWQVFSGIDLLLALCAVAGVVCGLALILSRRLDARPRERSDVSSVVIVAGALAAGLAVYRLVEIPLDPLHGEVTVEAGLYVALLAGLAMLGAGLWALLGGAPPGTEPVAQASETAAPGAEPEPPASPGMGSAGEP
jgi:hypothetical protein